MRRFAICLAISGALALLLFYYLVHQRNRQSGPFLLSARPTLAGPAASVPRFAALQQPKLNSSPQPAPASATVSPVAPEIPPGAIAEFSAWADRFLANDSTASLKLGIELAWKRRQEMAELIVSAPEKALTMAVPFRWRTAMPADITKYFEQQVDARGALEVTVGTDFQKRTSTVFRKVVIKGKRYKAFVFGPRTTQISQQNIPLHGIELDGNIAVANVTVRILEPAETTALEKASGVVPEKICGVSGQPSNYRNQQVAGEIGGEVRYFCGVDHIKLLNQHPVAASGGIGGTGQASTAANDNWTHGLKTVLYMRVNFPDDLTEPISEATAYDVMDGVNDFYTTQAYDLTALTATVTPLLTLPQPKTYYNYTGPGQLLDDARETARRAGFDTANYDRDIVTFTSVPTYAFGGLAYVGGKGVWLQSPGVGVTAHELGHNYGLWHANAWDTTNLTTIGYGTNLEYGNIYDTMGSGGVAQFNAAHKNVLDWLKDTDVRVASSNGVYRVFPFDVPTRVEGRSYAAIARKDGLRNYWIEFRQSYLSNPWSQYGVLLNWSPWPFSNGGTQLLDTTPGTPNLLNDAAVTIGRTYDDAAAGVHITPLGMDATGTNLWIDVQINMGDFPGNNPPSLRLELESTNAPPGKLIHFHATASDPDGDALAYAWSFDGEGFSSNLSNLPWTLMSWSGNGEHVVRCVVSDMKGGIASANGVVTIGNPSGFRISGHVLDTNGYPVEGVRIDNTLTNGQYYGAYSDSDGKYIITGATGDIPLYPVKYGFTFTNLTWTNPVSATSTMANIDFIAYPLPVVSFKVSTNRVAESNGVATITLSRTGDTSTNLTVSLYLSGTADIGSDYTLNPSFADGTNTIDFQPDQQAITITLRTINDGQIEGPETASLTLLEDPTYVPGYSGDATITILDDDAVNPPRVSIVARTPSILENGMDKGTFEITRAGGTQSSLTVFYSVSGTATPGQDYTALLGTVIIPAGSSSALVQFNTIDDKDVEPDETVIVSLSPNAAYSLGNNSSDQIKILDDDLLTVTIFPSGDGAAEPGATGQFTVQRQGELTANLLVFYDAIGTATSGVDYTTLSGSVMIPAGAASAPITLQPLDDTLLEGDETVTLTLRTNIAYNIGTPGSATLVIRDNERPTVSVSTLNGTISEAGDIFGSFLISRGTATSSSLSVNLAISGSATPGADYLPLDNPVTIPGGAASVTLNVIPFDDLHIETNETVIITLLPSTNYNGSGSATVVITDDDSNSVPAVGFAASASSAPESRSPGVAVGMSYTSAVPVMVDYRVIGGTASNTDYTLPQGTLTFEPGQLYNFIPLQIHDNSIQQPDRTIRLVLFNPINATLDAIKVHTYTILDDDAANVSITATAPAAAEGGPSGNFRISRTGSTSSPQVVNFQVTGTASAPSDYAPLGTSAVIPASATFVDLPVVVANELTVEHGETVVVTLTTAPGASIVTPNSATVSISDNDVETRPVVTITSTNHPFAVEGGGNGEFVFTRSGSATGDLTLYFTLAGTAINGVDYVALTNVVTISNGQSSASVQVVAIDDTLIEGNETVVAALTVLDTYRVAYPSSAIVTIQDNDQNVRLDVSDFIAAEPGTDQGEFTFTRTGTTNTPLQVFFNISGTASNGVDYVAISNSVVIPAGAVNLTLPIIPINDALVEGPETVTLSLLTNSAYALATPTNGTVTIMDDEPMLTITASTNSIVEGSFPPVILTVIRTGDPRYDFTAHLAVGGTATWGVDYPPFETNLHFTCGITSIDLTISPTNELIVEASETVTATITPDPAYTVLSPSKTVVTILDAGTNQTPRVLINSPTTNMVFLSQTNVNIILEATVLDDSDTNTPAALTWTNLTGATNFTFGNPTQSVTTASFTNPGLYELRLIADDGVLQGHADVTVVVGATEWLSTNSLHWTFDETSGTNVADVSGNGNNGALAGTPNWDTNGILGGALRLAGTNDCVRQTAGTNVLQGQREFSVSLWVKTGVTNLSQGILCANETATNGTFAIFTKTSATCGSSSNVIEATIPTSTGVARYISANNVLTNGWQHLMLTWSNGLAPVLYINGQPDQPFAHVLSWAGVLTNCPQFVVGKAPDSPNSWNGWVDEVRIYQRMLSATEVAALASLPPANYGAIVDAGTNVTVPHTVEGLLAGTVTDDGRPIPPGMVSNTWLQVSGPDTVVITNVNSLTNFIQFDMDGEFVFRLIGDDGQVKVYADVTNEVIEPTRVDVFASDSDAAELGPDTGEFTFTRTGDTNFDMAVFLTAGGTASNGVDFIALSNVVVFPAGQDTVKWTLVPFLDHRIEGDEKFTFTIVSNIAYTIGSGDATITIHDSPYGQWSVEHFTLEQLTFPNLSSEGADFDHDGLVNFAEYAANRDPITAETNWPVVTTVDLYPDDSQYHITITYPRRLEPTDTGYAVYVSNDLIHWQTGTNVVEELQTVDDGNNITQTVTARVTAPYTTSTNQFVDVKVWLRVTGP